MTKNDSNSFQEMRNATVKLTEGSDGIRRQTKYQYSETNVMHFLFSLLRINPLNAELNPICHLLALLGAHHILHVSRIRVKGLYMFRALLAHPQKVLPKRHLVYCVRVMSVGGTRGAAN
jgi:hypothetical protein